MQAAAIGDKTVPYAATGFFVDVDGCRFALYWFHITSSALATKIDE
jgi:hypothetical protein